MLNDITQYSSYTMNEWKSLIPEYRKYIMQIITCYVYIYIYIYIMSSTNTGKYHFEKSDTMNM